MKRIALFLIFAVPVLLFTSCGDPVMRGNNHFEITTGEASHISCRSAELSGSFRIAGDLKSDPSFGILYSSQSLVVLGKAIQKEAIFYDYDSMGFYSIATDILEPDMVYYYRSYFAQGDQITYGDINKFKTNPVSTMIETSDASYISETTATLNATLNLTDCKYDTLDYGFILTPQGHSPVTYKADYREGNEFHCDVYSLSSEKAYDVVAYVTLDGRTYTGGNKGFSTKAIQANITLNGITDVTELKATVSGKLSVLSYGQFSKSVTLYYDDSAETLDDLKTRDTAKQLTLYSDSFSHTIQNLEPNRTYHYAVIAIVDETSFSSEVKSFSTKDFSAQIETGDASSLGQTTATLNGVLSVTSIESLDKNAWFLISETAKSAQYLQADGIKYAASLSDKSIIATLSNLKPATTYYYIACAKVRDRYYYGSVVKSFSTRYAIPEAVDMGLSVKWGTFNVGASKPEEYGEYYAWGETTTKFTYNWSTYFLCKGSETTMTKYCVSGSHGTIDNKTTLEKADDVAAQKLGGNWRMPTNAEWTELRNTNNCAWSWSKENSVNGYRVTSKKTGNSIFLPATGFSDGSNLGDVGDAGCYWSSSLYIGFSYRAFAVRFYSDFVGWNDDDRYYGLSVRPVCN